jgi:phosphomethylpyrimidine synthase
LGGDGAIFDAEKAAIAVNEAGMADVSKLYNETGRELYMGAGDREHD